MHFLIVEDKGMGFAECELRRALELKGRDPRDYTCEFAKDAAAALKYTARKAFDLILADLNLDTDDLHSLEGLEGFIVPFRKKDQKTPIIAMNWNPENKDAALRPGANEFWQKGRNDGSLARLIAEYIR
jgi:CheY-like chemotaxis protein